jgi:2Fe-2S ferredoxin
MLGESVMAAAVRNGVPGITGECGGNCSCATCHVYVDDDFTAAVGGAGDMEDDLLDLGVAADRRDTSRLSCQIPLTEDLDGLVVRVPEEQ